MSTSLSKRAQRVISAIQKVRHFRFTSGTNFWYFLGSIPICAVCDIPIIGFGTRLNEYRSGQDVEKMARTVTVTDMLINQVLQSGQTEGQLKTTFLLLTFKTDPILTLSLTSVALGFVVNIARCG